MHCSGALEEWVAAGEELGVFECEGWGSELTSAVGGAGGVRGVVLGLEELGLVLEQAVAVGREFAAGVDGYGECRHE